MIDEKGKRHPSPPAPPAVPLHMLDGFNGAQRKALGITKAEVAEADKSSEPLPAKRAPKRVPAKRAAKKVAGTAASEAKE